MLEHLPPGLPRLEILELKDSPLRGHGLASLERHSRLRVLRVSLSEQTEFAIVSPLPSTLEVLDLSGLPLGAWGFDNGSGGLRALDWLTLHGTGNLYLEGSLPNAPAR